jgi:hypothetical protein
MTRYLFVDGNYLRSDFVKALDEFGVPEVDGAKNLWWPPVLARIKSELRCQKAFYYDSYDPEDEDKRRFIEWVRGLEGFHAPVGTLKPKSKGKPARQKEVDVQLAVDILTHVFRGNTKEVVLVAGDLDFNPLVTAVVEAGAWITLLYDGRSGDAQLRMSADLAMRISLQVYMRWAEVPLSNAKIRKTLRTG